MGLVDGIEVSIPGYFTAEMPVPSLDLFAISTLTRRDVGFVIGADILNNIAFMIGGSPTFAIVLAPPGSIRVGWEAPIEIAIGSNGISASIGNEEAVLGIDLGSSYDLTIAERRWDHFITDEQAVSSTTSIGAMGMPTRTLTAQLPLTIGTIERTARAVQVRNLGFGYDANLGFGFFAGETVLFDLSEGRILIRRPQ